MAFIITFTQTRDCGELTSTLHDSRFSERVNGMMKNLNDYHPPQMMPNGDIILRHKTPAEMIPGPEIEL